MKEVHLTGLEGTNPLGFLAAVGVQVAFDTEPDHPRLWWSDDFRVMEHEVLVRGGGGFLVRVPADTDFARLEQFDVELQRMLWRACSELRDLLSHP